MTTFVGSCFAEKLARMGGLYVNCDEGNLFDVVVTSENVGYQSFRDSLGQYGYIKYCIDPIKVDTQKVIVYFSFNDRLALMVNGEDLYERSYEKGRFNRVLVKHDHAYGNSLVLPCNKEANDSLLGKGLISQKEPCPEAYVEAVDTFFKEVVVKEVVYVYVDSGKHSLGGVSVLDSAGCVKTVVHMLKVMRGDSLVRTRRLSVQNYPNQPCPSVTDTIEHEVSYCENCPDGFTPQKDFQKNKPYVSFFRRRDDGQLLMKGWGVMLGIETNQSNSLRWDFAIGLKGGKQLPTEDEASRPDLYPDGWFRGAKDMKGLFQAGVNFVPKTTLKEAHDLEFGLGLFLSGSTVLNAEEIKHPDASSYNRFRIGQLSSVGFGSKMFVRWKNFQGFVQLNLAERTNYFGPLSILYDADGNEIEVIGDNFPDSGDLGGEKPNLGSRILIYGVNELALGASYYF